MRPVSVIDPVQDTRWDDFVKSHPKGLIGHLSEWKKVLEGSFAHIKGYYLVLWDTSGQGIRAGLPLYLVSSRLTGIRLVSVPFATLSDPLVTNKEEMQELLGAAIELSVNLHAKHIDIRTLASGSLVEDTRYRRVDLFTSHYLTLTEPAEHLMKRFHRTCIRRKIKRSTQSGLELNIAGSYQDLQSFFRLYTSTRKRLGLPPQPFRFFRHLWQVFTPSSRLVLLQALFQGKLVGGLVVFQFKNRMSAEFIAVAEDCRYLNPSHFLYWNAIKLACDRGFEIFDFGRTSVHNAGLLAFKRRWGTMVTELPQFWFPGNGTSPIYGTTRQFKERFMRGLVRKVPESFLPFLGEICYRHMG